ncbi:glycosyltransferase family 2 protein [Bradyrhizobium sp. BWA-3-5]|uniref:glycosyltransferase family 2 protein n=1 Tax=Bradyrhizobium sp. BWA-3-5 TaxID=3080013 RepID=UPI00293E93A5|nr:glycosyltransferase family 2 protein [Bradyrhizobium sp. BWA-3-5]WOH63913.1 glycosyltransferase family 2 protein [Bradyrhizobium sp. BWA-3-5]
MTKTISIVTPVFNEQDNVVELCSRIATVMAHTGYDYEHILVDNASIDRTLELLRGIAAKDVRVKVIVNTRNFGYIRSSFHAVLQASGDAVVLIAADLQDPPEMILEFIAKWEEGYKTIMAVKPTSDESSVMFHLRRLYYRLISRISDVSLIQNATGAGLYDRFIVDQLRKLDEPYPFFRGLVCEVGYKIATIPFHQPRRNRGLSSQNFYSLYDLAMLGVTKHSKVPLRLIPMLGFLVSIVSLAISLGYFGTKLLFQNSFELGLAPILVAISFFCGIQMLFLGLIGEYVGSIQTHVRNMPHVIEAERINFESEQQASRLFR